MKKFTNFDAEHHNNLDQNKKDMKDIEECESNFDSDEGVMMSHSDHMLEETTAHMLHVHNHKKELKNHNQYDYKNRKSDDLSEKEKNERVAEI